MRGGSASLLTWQKKNHSAENKPEEKSNEVNAEGQEAEQQGLHENVKPMFKTSFPLPDQ